MGKAGLGSLTARRPKSAAAASRKGSPRMRASPLRGSTRDGAPPLSAAAAAGGGSSRWGGAHTELAAAAREQRDRDIAERLAAQRAEAQRHATAALAALRKETDAFELAASLSAGNNFCPFIRFI